jgi:ParB/RepB/Spo0J family partition protein
MNTDNPAIIGKLKGYKISPDSILTTPGWNPREDMGDIVALAEDIRANGIMQFLKVRSGDDDKFYIIDGERRLLAVHYLREHGVNIEWVPCVLADKLSDAERLCMALSSNTGKPLTPVEQGQAFKRLKNYGLTLTEIARRTGSSVPVVSQRIALVDQASPAVLEAVGTKLINLAMAKELMDAQTTDEQDIKLDKMLEDTADFIKEKDADKERKRPRRKKDPDDDYVSAEYVDNLAKQGRDIYKKVQEDKISPNIAQIKTFWAGVIVALETARGVRAFTEFKYTPEI